MLRQFLRETKFSVHIPVPFSNLTLTSVAGLGCLFSSCQNWYMGLRCRTARSLTGKPWKGEANAVEVSDLPEASAEETFTEVWFYVSAYHTAVTSG